MRDRLIKFSLFVFSTFHHHFLVLTAGHNIAAAFSEFDFLIFEVLEVFLAVLVGVLLFLFLLFIIAFMLVLHHIRNFFQGFIFKVLGISNVTLGGVEKNSEELEDSGIVFTDSKGLHGRLD